MPFFQDAVHHPDETGPFWRDANVLCGFEQPVPSTHIVTGWYVHRSHHLQPTCYSLLAIRRPPTDPLLIVIINQV